MPIDRESLASTSMEGLPPKRRELLNWFRGKAAPLADAYEGATRLIDEPEFPGRIHFIAHAVRDIADRLAYVLDPQQASRRVQYENEMDKIAPEWPELRPIDESGGAGAATDTVTIPYILASRIDSLVTAHRKRRDSPSNYELLFHFLMRQELSGADLNKRLVTDFKSVCKWFMRHAHLTDKTCPAVDNGELCSQFSKFESMLHSFVGDFFTGTAELDDILQQANQQAG